MKVLTRRDYIQVSKSSKASDPPRPMWMGITPGEDSLQWVLQEAQSPLKTYPGPAGRACPCSFGSHCPRRQSQVCSHPAVSSLPCFPGGAIVNNPPSNAGDTGDAVQPLGREDPLEEGQRSLAGYRPQDRRVRRD